MDDSGLTGDWEEEILSMKNHLLQEFQGCDLGEPNIYVGIQLERRENGILLHQAGYAKKIIKTHLGNITRDAPTPLQKGADLTPRNPDKEGPLDLLKYPYQQIVGQLLYLANMTRPDIANATRELGKVSSDPTIRPLEISPTRVEVYIRDFKIWLAIP